MSDITDDQAAERRAFAAGFGYGLEAAIRVTDGLFVVVSEVVGAGMAFDPYERPLIAAATVRRDRVAVDAAHALRRLREHGACATWLLYTAESR